MKQFRFELKVGTLDPTELAEVRVPADELQTLLTSPNVLVGHRMSLRLFSAVAVAASLAARVDASIPTQL